jgi:hypothetical protein
MIPLAKSTRPAPADDDAAVDAALNIKRVHPYQRCPADPARAAPKIHVDHRHRLTGVGHRVYAGTVYERPAVLRAGSDQAAQYPSRHGDRLTWPDGRRTWLDGSPIEEVSE